MAEEPPFDETHIPDSASTLFGDYELLEEVARGGMGVVYRARQVSLDRIVAIKLILSGEDASQDELSRFRSEAQSAARLDHPGIVPVYGCGELEGQPYLSMGFVNGPSLSRRLADKGPLPPREAAALLLQVAEAIDSAHRRNVVHRDLKPGNVLIDEDGRARVTDFGLAKRQDAGHSLTATGQLLGTPAYMSPEQASGDEAGPSSDIYSLGATLYAALTGQPPFTATSVPEVLLQVTEEAPSSVRIINPNVPAVLDAICLKCLEKKPQDRYATAKDLADDLRRFVNSEPLSAVNRGLAKRTWLWRAAAVPMVIIAVAIGIWFGRRDVLPPIPIDNPSETVTANTEVLKSGFTPEESKLMESLTGAQDALLPIASNVWEYRYAEGAAACEQAFREFGFTLDQGDPSQLAETLKRRSPEFRESVLGGLELWELCAVAAKQTAVIEPLRQAQDSLDVIEWRRSLRLARADADEKIVLQVVREALSESLTPEQIERLALLIGSRSPEKNFEALGVLRSLLQESPTSFLTNVVMASALQAIGRTKFAEGAAYASEAVIPLRAAAKARPTSVLPQAQLVAVFTDLGNTAAATTEREKLYQRQYQEAWPRIVAARQARESKQYDQALTLLREALAKQADVPQGEVELAATLILKGQDAEAEPLLLKLAQNAVDDGAAYQVLQEVFWLVEPPTSGNGKPSREVAANNPSSARVWRAFNKYRRNLGAAAPPIAIAPFDAEQATQHQEAWAKHLGVPVEYTTSIGMKFRLIPPGEFLMGSTPTEIEEALKDVEEIVGKDDMWWQACIKSEGPQHRVLLTRPFYLGAYEVTQSQYEAVMGLNPSGHAATGAFKDRVAGLDTTRHPVEMVSWNDATEFCAKLSQQANLQPFHVGVGETLTPSKGTGYRLPTEAEWEFSCRAGTTSKYWIGDKDEDLVSAGWFKINTEPRTHPVGELKANPFGLYDVHGNVIEWTQDCWKPAYEWFSGKPALAVQDSSFASIGSERTSKGGCFDHQAIFCQTRHHPHFIPTIRVGSLGFRAVLVVDAVKAAIAERTAEIPPPAIAPFDAEEARQHQAAWARHHSVPVEYTNSIGMKFRLIPPGEFLMGSTSAEIEQALQDATDFNNTWHTSIRSEAPQHQVMLTQPIYFGAQEVTQAQYEKVMGRNPSHFTPTGGGKEAVEGMDTSIFPVDTVTWNDAVEFSVTLSQQEKLRPFLLDDKTGNLAFDGNGYRLPTEAEWEFACRAGTTTRYWSGDQVEDLLEVGWFNTNSQHRSHAVGELKPNPFGLYDIHGNQWEWVQDRWEATYYAQFPGRPAIDPRGPLTGENLRMRRSGDWPYGATYSRSSCRHAIAGSPAYPDLGFRVALTVDAVKAAMPKHMDEPESTTTKPPSN